MAAVASMVSPAVAIGLGSRLSVPQAVSKRATAPVGLGRRSLPLVRCEADRGGLGGLRQAVDDATKKTITKEEIVHNQETNESEKKSIFGNEPGPNSLYGRPEVERRPETGDKSFAALWMFDGAVPETVNCRLAMLGMVWAFFAEKATGLTVAEQLGSPGQTGLVFFVGAVQLFTYASLVPIFNGESTDARSFGPFTAQAERWNGRLAMIGFFSLLVTEAIRQAPVFH